MGSLFASRKFRDITLQAGFLAVVSLVIAGAVYQGRQNIATQGLNTGFGFLDRATGFDVAFSLIEFSAYDSYGRLLLVGLLNTVFLGFLGIALANLVGLIVAALRISQNRAFNMLGTLYVELFRNVPMILQAVFWYALLTQLPGPREAIHGFGIFLTSRGLYIPGLNVTGASLAMAFGCLFLALIAVIWFSMSRRFSRVPIRLRRRVRWSLVLAGLAVGGVILFAARIPETPVVSWPALKGLNIRGGSRIQPEFVALLVAMAIYGGAYIAEIVRAGFLSVGKGQAEAAQSLGLTPWQVFSRVRLPLAVRAVLPTLINQYVWLFKATTLGIAVGYTDFFAVISVSINQAGQTMELIGLLMLGFLVINNSIAFVLNRVNAAIALRGTQLRT